MPRGRSALGLEQQHKALTISRPATALPERVFSFFGTPSLNPKKETKL
jgi:hypothetical protein